MAILSYYCRTFAYGFNISKKKNIQLEISRAKISKSCVTFIRKIVENKITQNQNMHVIIILSEHVEGVVIIS